MYKGKRTCEALKSIRQEIAVANGIAYNPRQCDHEGDCLGTCPACEQEARYIENQLNLRKMAGKAIKIVGLASAFALASCGSTAPSPEEIEVIGIMENPYGNTEGEGEGESAEPGNSSDAEGGERQAEGDATGEKKDEESEQ